jgi:hypothetical protein
VSKITKWPLKCAFCEPPVRIELTTARLQGGQTASTGVRLRLRYTVGSGSTCGNTSMRVHIHSLAVGRCFTRLVTRS